jgi:hypothetical protein
LNFAHEIMRETPLISKGQLIHGIRSPIDRFMGRIADHRHDGCHGAPDAHWHRYHFGQETSGKSKHQQEKYQVPEPVHRKSSRDTVYIPTLLQMYRTGGRETGLPVEILDERFVH